MLPEGKDEGSPNVKTQIRRTLPNRIHNMPAKVVLLTEIISPYRIPVFNEIARNLRHQFLVVFFAESRRERLWRIYKENIRFSYKVLPGISAHRKDSTRYFLNPTIIYELGEYSPDVIIVSGYSHPSSFLAMLYAKMFKQRIILWGESNKYDQRYYYPLKESYKRWYVKNCTEYLAAGAASFEYLVSLGAVADRIWVAPDAVDNDFFSQAYDKERKVKEMFRCSKGYPEKIILYVGRLIDQKGIFDLLKAFQALLHKRPDLGLVLLGNGPQENAYKHFCQVNNLKNVFFEGFVHQEDLPAYYAIADVLVLPTHSDPWGLVINEAMACKLPVIATDVAGAVQDLIYNGENGYVYKKGDIGGLVKSIQRVLNGDKGKMGQKSYEIVQNYSPQKCAQGFLEVIGKTRNTAYPRVVELKAEIGKIHE